MSNPAPPTSTTARTDLRRSLSRLHQELASAPQVDASSRRLLREVLDDIERLLAVQTGAPAAPAVASAAQPRRAEAESAPQRLEALAVEFEAYHPVLAASVRQFIDLLGRAGL